MHALGKRLGEAVGQRLGQDRGVIVIGVLEAFDHGFFAEAGGHRERADIVAQAARPRRDEIGERDIGAALATRELLTQRMQGRDRLVSLLIAKNQNIVALAVRRPEADDGAGAKPLLGDHLLQHRLRIGEQAARRLADGRVLQDRRIFAVELPGGEERRPVDVIDKLGDRDVGQRMRAEKARHRRHVIAGPIQLQRIGARVGKRQPLLVLLAAGMRGRDPCIFGAHIADVTVARVARQQRRDDADGAARVIDIDRLTAPVIGMDLDGGVHAARGGAADQERHVEALAFEFGGDVTHLVERWRDEAG